MVLHDQVISLAAGRICTAEMWSLGVGRSLAEPGAELGNWGAWQLECWRMECRQQGGSRQGPGEWVARQLGVVRERRIVMRGWLR